MSDYESHDHKEECFDEHYCDNCKYDNLPDGAKPCKSCTFITCYWQPKEESKGE